MTTYRCSQNQRSTDRRVRVFISPPPANLPSPTVWSSCAHTHHPQLDFGRHVPRFLLFILANTSTRHLGTFSIALVLRTFSWCPETRSFQLHHAYRKSILP